MSFSSGLKTIVVATDLGGQSEAALEYARKLAGAYGARVVLAHGVDPVDYAAVDGIPGKVLDLLTAEARAALDRMTGDLLREGIHSHSEVRQGAVAQMLVDVARQYQAGLIVMSTRGMEGAGPVLVGSIAEQLVRLAPCPVLAVAADWNAGEHRPTPGGPVLLAAERNEAAQAAVETAYSLAETFQRTLLVVHARTAAEASAILNPCGDPLKELGFSAHGSVHVECVVRDGEPADAVEQAIARYRPSILVVGVKRASHLPGPHGTAFALLARSRVPVLCVPPALETAAPEKETCVSAEVA
ncbi:MAG TPA: universal stress protein [Terracidiphilus sp.]|nr:universal stress protein [Terracidiphilus sp.]